MSSIVTGASAHGGKRLSSPTTLLFAVAAGLCVANVYYAQPLLDSIAKDLRIAPAVVGSVVTMTQVGYALGLILLVPLGDLVDRRRLIISQCAAAVVALVVVATAGTAGILFAGMVATGFLAVAVHVLVAFAATLATPDERGRAIGTVTSGVVVGILAARFVSGLLADLGGWRAVYATSAAMMLVMVGILRIALPRRPPHPERGTYGRALLSVPAMFMTDRVLLTRGALALLAFAAFSTFWTALVLPLSAEPYSYSHVRTGLFGVVGMAGALAASGAGRLADRGLGQTVTGAALVLLLASWGLIALLHVSIALLVVGVVMLDMAVQAVHVTNQSIIVARHPEASSRVVGGYMVFYSVGSALGAIGSTAAYARWGWSGVSVLGAAITMVAVLVWLATLALARLPTVFRRTTSSC